MTEDSLRLNQYLARCGAGSRRKAEDLIRSGRVHLNGAVVTDLGVRVHPEDRVELDGTPVRPLDLLYLVMHKPRGVVSAVTDPRDRTVVDLLPPRHREAHPFPVGRLDRDSEGLLVLTNDGDFAQGLLHPREGIVKRYEVQLDRPLAEEHRRSMLEGLWSEGELLRPLAIRSLDQPDRRWFVFELVEGKKREIRRLAALHRYGVLRLIRRAVGQLELRRLEMGKVMELSRDALWRQILRGGIV